VFAGAAAAKIATGDDNRVRRFHLAGRHETGGILALRQAGEGVGAKFVILVGNGGDEIEILGRDDLVGVDIVAHHESLAADDGTHDRGA